MEVKTPGALNVPLNQQQQQLGAGSSSTTTTTTAAAAAQQQQSGASERNWEIVTPAKLFDKDYTRVVSLSQQQQQPQQSSSSSTSSSSTSNSNASTNNGGRVCYRVDPLIADVLVKTRGEGWDRRHLWRVITSDVPPSELISVRKESREWARLKQLGCDVSDNALVTARGALSVVTAMTNNSSSSSSGVNQQQLDSVRGALVDLIAKDEQLLFSLSQQQQQQQQQTNSSTTVTTTNPNTQQQQQPPPAKRAAPSPSQPPQQPPPQQQPTPQQQSTQQLMAMTGMTPQQLMATIGEMKMQSAELRTLLLCMQQDIASIRQTGSVSRHSAPIPTKPEITPATPSTATTTMTTTATTPTTSSLAGAGAGAGGSNQMTVGGGGDDDTMLESAKEGLRTILKFLSPKQTVSYISFLEEILQQYRS